MLTGNTLGALKVALKDPPLSVTDQSIKVSSCDMLLVAMATPVVQYMIDPADLYSYLVPFRLYV